MKTIKIKTGFGATMLLALIALLIFMLMLSSCASYHTCATYSINYKNETKGSFGCQDSDLKLSPGDEFIILPSGDRIKILTVTVN